MFLVKNQKFLLRKLLSVLIITFQGNYHRKQHDNSLFQAEGHIVTCETITGEVYRGRLIEAEDNMNCQMSSVAVTFRDGRVANLENIYIRGSKIRFDSVQFIKNCIVVS